MCSLQAFQKLREEETKESQEREALEKKLAAVAIKKEDVSVLAKEFELEESAADRILREQNGDLKAAILHCLNV